MPKDFNLGLVFLSYLVAVTASHVTLLLAARVRDPHTTNWKLWVLCGGFAMGIGIWSMHFVATLALRLPIEVMYDLPLTALSWVFAIVACGAAFIVLRRLTGKHREFLLPGALIGIGIASMHYTGDASMRLFPAIRYDPLLFAVSVLIAIGAATAALWIAFHLARQRAVFTNFGAALVMGAAVVGMHFTAVAAANFSPAAICLASGMRLDDAWMAYTIGGFTFVILTATMLLSAYDARLSSAIATGAARLRHANEQLERRVRERTEELRKAHDAARAGSQAKSAFVATMSHEIRTPMNAIIGMLELLSLSELTADQREMLTTARESSRSLLGLIDDILDFSKIEVGKLELCPEPCSVARVVDGVNATFKHVASGRGVLFTRRIDAKLWPAHLLDPSRLRQVLTNLVGNAIKFTPAGSVTLEVHVLDEAEGRQTLRFSVHDTGIGMSAETQRRLFEPFQQGESDTTRRFGGTGLGLAISRQLVELMGGTIQVTSAEGLGTRVTVTLDAAQASAEAVAGEASPAAPAPLRAPAGTELLIVDDHPVNLAMLQRQLKVLGVEADTATCGEEALAKWRRKGHKLVITDLQMPEMDGYALTRAIRAEERPAGRPTVVAFTANTQREALERCTAAGMDDYLTKPTELLALREKLVRWLGGDAGLASVAPENRAEAPADDPIDRGRIRELVGTTDNVARVLAQVAAGAREDIKALQAALAGGNTRTIRQAAHRIRGSALSIGAERLAAAALPLERGADPCDPAQLADAVQALVAELKVVLAATEAERTAATA